MQYGEGALGRLFALRLDEGERLPEVLETFAREHNIAGAMVIFLGGLKDGSRLVVGPEKRPGDAIVPMITSPTSQISTPARVQPTVAPPSRPVAPWR